MNIYIKCSSRPFYVDRLLRSVGRHCRGVGRVVLLNDGIPPSEISRLKRSFPEVEDRASPRLTGGERADPARFWAESVAKEGRAHVLVLEEDTWLTGNIDLGETARLLAENKALMLRMFWHGSEVLVAPAQIEYRVAMRDGNTLEFYGKVATTRWLDLYNYFCIAHGVFRADYYSQTLLGLGHWADEVALLHAAVDFINGAVTRGERFRLCKTGSELIRHCSTTTTRPDSGGVGLAREIDAARINRALTQAWEEGALDVMAGFPDDIPAETVAGIIARYLGPASLADWQAWRASYLAMYAAMGAKLQ